MDLEPHACLHRKTFPCHHKVRPHYMPLLQQQTSTKEARAQARSRTFFFLRRKWVTHLGAPYTTQLSSLCVGLRLFSLLGLPTKTSCTSSWQLDRDRLPALLQCRTLSWSSTPQPHQEPYWAFATAYSNSGSLQISVSSIAEEPCPGVFICWT